MSGATPSRTTRKTLPNNDAPPGCVQAHGNPVPLVLPSPQSWLTPALHARLPSAQEVGADLVPAPTSGF